VPLFPIDLLYLFATLIALRCEGRMMITFDLKKEPRIHSPRVTDTRASAVVNNEDREKSAITEYQLEISVLLKP